MIRTCPECNREITSLRNTVTGSLEYYLSLDTQGDTQYEEREFQPDIENNDYCCPKCHKVLFTSEEEAIAFLKGE